MITNWRDNPLAAARLWALWLMAAITLATSAVSFGQSYRGLYDWATNHAGIPLPWAAAWPLMVDSFLAVGELRLFVAAVDGDTHWITRLWGWGLAAVGLAASVAGNIGHVGWPATPAVAGSAALPPIAAAAALGTGLGLIKTIVRRKNVGSETLTVADAAGPPAVRASREDVAPVSSPRRTRSGGAPHSRGADPVVIERASAGIREVLAAGHTISDRRAAEQFGVTRYAAGNMIAQIENELAKHAKTNGQVSHEVTP